MSNAPNAEPAAKPEKNSIVSPPCNRYGANVESASSKSGASPEKRGSTPNKRHPRVLPPPRRNPRILERRRTCSSGGGAAGEAFQTGSAYLVLHAWDSEVPFAGIFFDVPIW